MARYKVLKSVAHNLAHSFTSGLNYVGNDYVMGHLLANAVATAGVPIGFLDNVLPER